MSAHRHHGHEHGDPHDRHADLETRSLSAFRLSTLLNVALVLVEAGIGVWIGSMALLGDAGHNLSDVLGLLLAWGAARLSIRRPSARHTYGFARSTILAALLNAALLLVACGALTWESIDRIGVPHEVPDGWGLLVRRGRELELAVRPVLHDTTPAERVALIERIAAVAAKHEPRA